MAEPGSARSIAPQLPQVGGQQSYGEQASQDWRLGEVDDRPVLDLVHSPSVWRVALYGENVEFRIVYGTKANKVIEHLASPALLTIPGQCSVYARPLSAEAAASARVTATQATAGASSARRIVSGPALALEPDAAFFRALVASTVTIRGTAVVLAPLDVVPLVAGSVLTAGTGYLEFNP